MARLVNDTDRAIIRLLQRNARMSYAELSRATGTPESTVRRRMDRLQQRGVIEFAMVAEPAKLGYDLRAMIGLKVDLHRLTEIADSLRAMNEITFAAFLTGNFDIMIHVVVESQEDLVGLLTEKLSKIEGVRSTETFVMPWIIKPTTSWILPDHESHPAADGIDDGTDDDDGDELLGDDQPEPTFADRLRQRQAKIAAVGRNDKG
jgi:Lrp/AsnC family transcriptional regulator for asnA, asnC and gidA